MRRNLSEIPTKVRKAYVAIAELWFADHGAVFYRGEIVLKGEAYTLDVFVSDLNQVEEALFEGESSDDVEVLEMLDKYDAVFGDTHRNDIEDGSEYQIDLSESIAPWELGWKFIPRMAYGAFPTAWEKEFKSEMKKQGGAK